MCRRIICFDAMKRSFYRNLVLGFMFINLCSMTLFTSCQRLNIEEESEQGTLTLSVSLNELPTRADPREIPDTNTYILTIKSSGGDVLYSGKYADRPAKLTLNAGSYEVVIASRNFEAPEFHAPVFGDSKTVIITAGQNSSVLLICKQTNSGIRLMFSSGLVEKYKDYEPVFETTKGKLTYPFTESRYAYFFPESVKLSLIPKSSGVASLFLFNKLLSAGDMKTINLDVTKDQAGNSFCSVKLDTTANWMVEDFIVGQTPGDDTGSDGSSKAKAISCSKIGNYIGRKDIWIYGYIVGGDLSTKEMKTTPPFVKDSHFAISYSPSVKTREQSYGICLSSDKLQQNFSLVKHPEFLKKKVYIRGTIKDVYFGFNGVNPTNEIVVE